MILKTSTKHEKYFYFENSCHGYEHLHVGKEKIRFILKHHFLTASHDKSPE